MYYRAELDDKEWLVYKMLEGRWEYIASIWNVDTEAQAIVAVVGYDE